MPDLQEGNGQRAPVEQAPSRHRSESSASRQRFSRAVPCVVAVLVLVGLLIGPPARAQVPNISGEWNTVAAIYGQLQMTLRQDGNIVTGTYGGRGRIQGTLNGNELRGTFEDVMTSGSITFRFSPDGSNFQGYYARGGPNANGSADWRGTRVASTTAASPDDMLAQRANLAQVTQTAGAPLEQAKTACSNLFSATFTRDNDVATTRFTVRQGSFAPVLGAPQQAAGYLAFGGFDLTLDRPTDLSDSDRRNGWQFHQRILLRAQSFQLVNNPQDRNWKTLGEPRPVIVCIFGIRDNRPFIAVEKPIERILGMELPHMANWSRP